MCCLLSLSTRHLLDEYVVFHKTQTLPRFWIELGVALPISPSAPQMLLTTEQMLDEILKLLDKPSIQQDPALHHTLEAKAEQLLEQDQTLPPSQEDLKFYTCTKKLLDEAGKVRDVVHKQLTKLTGAPALPAKKEVAQAKAPAPAPVFPKPIAAKAAAPFLPAAAFGALKWNQYFGIQVVEPPLPPDIDKILLGPCPIFPGKRVAETHFLTLIPEGMTLERLEALAQNPKQGNKIGFRYKNQTLWSQYGKTPAGKTHWALMTNDVIPDSRSKNWKDQQALAAQYRPQGYEIPSVIDAVASLFLEHVQTGKRFYTDSPDTYTRCVEQVTDSSGNKWPAAIGGFAPAGLSVLYDYDGVDARVGLGVVRTFC